MPFTLEQVVPWGRSYDEYLRMFRLTEADLAGAVLGCADGPAAFNAEAARRGLRVTSCDPVYRFSREELARRVEETYGTIMEQLRRNTDAYLWEEFRTPEEVGATRMAAMRLFLEDFDQGRNAGRYLDAELPELPFPRAHFDLALCSHFLFLYSDHLTLEFHLASLRELARVATEVRVFPLLTLGGEPSPYLTPLLTTLTEEGYQVAVESVAYEFQRGANRMLRIQAPG
ncbi:MAG TPA: class I SAM-dependent methyltransferase [Armatimonadota bacterium]